MKSIETKPRYDFIDILRIVACFFVIVNHTITFVFLGAEPSRGWFISLIWFYISKLSVPVFVMITGYTLLDRQDSYKKSLVRIARAVGAVGLFSLVCYLYRWSLGEYPKIGMMDFLKSVLENPLSLAYWYMYMYIGLLIMMPFLQKLAASLSKKDVEILIGISLLVYGTCPIIEHWCGDFAFTELVDLALFDSYVGMLFIAYYIKKYVIPSGKMLIGSIVGFVVCIAFNVTMTYQEYQITGGDDYLFYDDRVFLPIVLQGACFFYMVQHISLKGWLAKAIQVVAGCTFGIYLISDLVIRFTIPWFHKICETGLNAIIAMIIYEIVVFVVGFVVVFVMKKIPLLDRLV